MAEVEVEAEGGSVENAAEEGSSGFGVFVAEGGTGDPAREAEEELGSAGGKPGGAREDGAAAKAEGGRAEPGWERCFVELRMALVCVPGMFVNLERNESKDSQQERRRKKPNVRFRPLRTRYCRRPPASTTPAHLRPSSARNR